MTINLEEIAKIIISNCKSLYLNNDGLLSRTYPASDRSIFDNFDDIAPFLIYFGEVDFLVEQVIISQKVKIETLLGHNGVILSHKVDEYLGGLYAVYKATGKKNSIVFNALLSSIEFLEKIVFYNNDLFISYDSNIKIRSNVRTYWSSGLLETFLELSEDFPRLLPLALKVLDNWICDPYFMRHGLFTFRTNPDCYLFNKVNNSFSLSEKWNNIFNKNVPIPEMHGKNKFKSIVKTVCFEKLPTGNFIQLMKANSTMIFLLIEAYRLTKNNNYRDKIEKWIGSSYSKFTDGKNVYDKLDMNFNKHRSTLADAFIYIDLLCDTYYFVNRNSENLNKAKSIVEHWLDMRWENGLMPMFIGSEVDHIDNIVDFSVSLRRFSDLTGDKTYRSQAKQLLFAAIEYHYCKEGFFTQVNKYGGKIDGKKYNNIDPKYNGLFLKGIINCLTLSENMYSSKLHDLFKDR